MQFLPLCIRARIPDGTIAKTAPIGHRCLQKNLSSTDMATIIIPKIIMDAKDDEKVSLKLPDTINENTVQGLYFVTRSFLPKKHRIRITASTGYFIFHLPITS